MEQSTIREAVAVFDDAEKLESAVSELQSKGIDRSELSFLAHDLPVGRIPTDLRRAADDPATPREPVVSDTDLRQGRVLGTGLAATIAAFAAAGFTVATGGVAAATIAAALRRRAVSALPAHWSGANWQTIRRHFSMPNSPAVACCFGSARAMPPVSKPCSKCSGGTRRMYTSTIYRLRRIWDCEPKVRNLP
jgi:hypothetical protein